MKILLKQQGKRILLDTSEYELYTDKSKDYSEIVNYLVKEGANKSYGTRAFTGNPLILND